MGFQQSPRQTIPDAHNKSTSSARCSRIAQATITSPQRQKHLIKKGDTILVHYAGRVENGDMFDSSAGQAPLKFTVGAGTIIAGFDNAVVGMQPGEKKTITIAPDDGYGYPQDENIVTIARGDSPEEQNVAVGMPVYLVDHEGENIPGIVTGVLMIR
jgi:peptidylprolyl isomerase